MSSDFNAINDTTINNIKDTITPERAQLEPITCLYEMKQLILEPTNILQ